MTRDLTAGMVTEATKSGSSVIEPIIFWKGAFDEADLNIWSGVGDLVWDGDTYTGAGDMIEIDEARETMSLRANGMTFGLNGLDEAIIATVMLSEYQGRICRVWLGAFSGGSIVSDPVPIFVGFFDVMQVIDQPDADTASIRITAESRLIALERPNKRRWTPEDQKAIYPGDTFFDYVAQLQDKEIEL
jgi:hypothetical protein